MILYPQDRQLIVDALVYMVRSAYTEDEIRKACEKDLKMCDEMLEERRKTLRRLLVLVNLLKL